MGEREGEREEWRGGEERSNGGRNTAKIKKSRAAVDLSLSS